jgi:glycosyltransferase involved in cell wall biosynthesis
MKVIVQIPCYNEEKTLEVALRDLPREIPGASSVEWLVIDDGSSDRTAEVALDCGVDHVIRRPHEGLARTFMAGIEACLARGADVIVNTDADNQYVAADIPKLVAPVLAGQADMVVGERPIGEIEHFSPLKKLLQRIGSWAVRLASATEIADAPSGFRAIGREAALRLNVFNYYTYTLETIIQCGQRNMRVLSVPIRTNPFLRPSRLLRSIPSYVQRSILTILRIFLVYKPLRFFAILGSVPFAAGVLLMVRWLVLFLFVTGATRTHLPSLVLAAVLVVVGFQLWAIGLLADLISVNRKILEDVQLRLRRHDHGN